MRLILLTSLLLALSACAGDDPQATPTPPLTPDPSVQPTPTPPPPTPTKGGYAIEQVGDYGAPITGLEYYEGAEYALDRDGTVYRDGEALARVEIQWDPPNAEEGALSLEITGDVAYVGRTPPDCVRCLAITRYSMPAFTDPLDVFRTDILPPDETAHNGGNIQVGPDGNLYVGVGDGGGEPERAQDPASLQGKLLRITPAGAVSVYAMGFRNPWRFSFGPDGTLWLADVGEVSTEEINIVREGGNYGWPRMEGYTCSAGPCEAFARPAYAYAHPPVTLSAAITGGYVYRGEALPELRGWYVYADQVSGEVSAYNAETDTNVLLGTGPNSIISFSETPDGELLTLHYSGMIGRLGRK